MGCQVFFCDFILKNKRQRGHYDATPPEYLEQFTGTLQFRLADNLWLDD